MIFADGFGTLILLGLWIFCIIDVITTDEAQVRNLPKPVWLLLVIVLPDLGSIAWLVAGHSWGASKARAPLAHRAAQHPDDDDEFLRGLQRRADEQRKSRDDKQPPADET